MAAVPPFLRTAAAVAAAVLLSACGSRQVIDKINLAQTASYDLAGSRTETAVLVGDYAKKGETRAELLSTGSTTRLDMIPRLQAKSGKTLQYGQLRMVVFGKAFASQGIGDILENFFRDPKVSSRLQLAVADGEASKLLAAAGKRRDASYLLTLVEDNMKHGNLPRLGFQKTLFDYYGEGRDIVLPYLTTERGEIAVGGAALFKGDAYAGRVDANEAFLLKLLAGSARDGSYTAALPGAADRDSLVIRCLSSKTKLRLLQPGPVPAIRFDVRLNVLLQEVPHAMRAMSDRELAKLEEELRRLLEGRIEAFATDCAKKGLDPLGLGDFARSRTETFYAAYPSLKAEAKVDLRIAQTGVGKMGHRLAR
ncbi:Ger(x)C family spore germination protein [Paenibacillus sp. MWE-103]|uniref:Ger(X)C family spore germination protein n=1 Tax=Paenibacillus artemisiicola TaxID=1172618 RepID=A0ABS3W4P9_9BACL|nr:Ger(x)C family spore germination protein [Paenibacillus artemisiicola]MBO7743287.1 Ger(x)C family spore germination protein [Paenibacillus artemisiicola]